MTSRPSPKLFINSSTEMKFNESLRKFEYVLEKQVVLNYPQRTWLPFQKLFVTAWTDMHMNSGNRVTSRAKVAHSTLKRYLQFSTWDLVEVKNKICLEIKNEFQEIKKQH